MDGASRHAVRSVLMLLPHFGGRQTLLALRGTLSPLDTKQVPKETCLDIPLSFAQQTRPRRCGAGIGIKVRQSWTLIGNFMRRTAAEMCYTYR